MEKLERVARAMAAADGRDPDLPIGSWQIKRMVGGSMPVAEHDPQLASWKYYVPLAKLTMAAFEVLQAE